MQVLRHHPLVCLQGQAQLHGEPDTLAQTGPSLQTREQRLMALQLTA